MVLATILAALYRPGNPERGETVAAAQPTTRAAPEV
jgi:hypothetical protein